VAVFGKGDARFDANEADVSVQTEAVFRVMTQNRPAAEISPHAWRSAGTMSATLLDLTNPLEITPGMSASDAVAEAVDRMGQDDRIQGLTR
jgi:hypothetical protein